ncbi:epoxide hydrolase family protein [Desmospora activa]|uniref:Pimeloyl-ACP methyl ester carboxylesterase n=1 Tax=Desmospora activa DSM 45169 TaxID=1121389 RepID=A0A2T4ZA18_9BACL|nr:epoxide hydrolase family protein [Desmospora activa]PTM58738.1 pimeloyl-ACP methyl ester carboxylesterase [Desmospora activa DSM 45169]
MADTNIRSFRIDFPQTELDELQDRLARTRWPYELSEVGWDYGVPLKYAQEMVEYWQHKYDWRKHEAELNELPQFTTTIDGADVHFLHVRSPEPNALPLLLTHGWPSSIVEFIDIIGPLTNPRAYGGDPDDAFHLVIPSIPGFTLSGPTRETGWNVQRIALAWAELMKRLNYDRYGVQGGDWGSAISREVGALEPDRVVGVHLNYLVTPPSNVSGLSEEEKVRLSRIERYLAKPAGYMRIQSTQPQTLAYGLTDSPVGQLAWIAEKFYNWTDRERPVAIDRLLTNVMLYWLTGTASSSAWLYYEAAKSGRHLKPCNVPLGVAVFPHDLILPVRRIAELNYSIVHWTEFNHGGHLPALEVPDLLIGDLRKFFRRFR